MLHPSSFIPWGKLSLSTKPFSMKGISEAFWTRGVLSHPVQTVFLSHLSATHLWFWSENKAQTRYLKAQYLVLSRFLFFFSPTVAWILNRRAVYFVSDASGTPKCWFVMISADNGTFEVKHMLGRRHDEMNLKWRNGKIKTNCYKGRCEESGNVEGKLCFTRMLYTEQKRRCDTSAPTFKRRIPPCAQFSVNNTIRDFDI